MTDTTQEDKKQQKAATERVAAAQTLFTPPSQDEEAFLKNIEQASKGYDPSVTVGGPRNFKA